VPIVTPLVSTAFHPYSPADAWNGSIREEAPRRGDERQQAVMQKLDPDYRSPSRVGPRGGYRAPVIVAA